LDGVRNQVRAAIGQPAYDWGLVVIAAAAVVVWAWGLGTLVRLADIPIVTTTVIN
jgi:hypothetical protein